MAAFSLRKGCIGNLILMIACLFQKLYCVVIHSAVFFVTHLLDIIQPKHSIQRSTFLYLKTVKREMIRPQSDSSPQGTLPGIRCTAGNSENQIDIDIFKSGSPRHSETAFRFPGGMNPPQKFQFFILKRLNPYTQAIDSRPPVSYQTVIIHGGRVDFHRDFRIPGEQITGSFRGIFFTAGADLRKIVLPLAAALFLRTVASIYFIAGSF